jgi:hypothetical protein
MSRACLGKMIILIIERLKRSVVRTIHEDLVAIELDLADAKADRGLLGITVKVNL